MYTRALEVLPICLIIALLAASLYTDLRYGKIYNKFTLPCIALGIMIGTAAHGWQGLLQGIGGVLVVLVPFLLFAPMAGIGGGDTKLMMAVGALLGLPLAVWAMIYSAVAGGILALIVMARYRALLATTRNMAGNIYLSAVLRAPVELSSGSKGIKFRYTPAITIGTLAAYLLQRL